MRERVFVGHGIEVYRYGERFWIRYDAGEIVQSYREVEVSHAEAMRAMQSEHDAYDVLVGRAP